MPENDSPEVSPLDEMVNDRLEVSPSPEPAVSAEPAAAIPEGSTTGTPEPTEESPTQQAAAATPPSSYVVGGRTYSTQDLERELTSAQQFPHLQKKYLELLESSRSQVQDRSQAQAPPTRQLDPKQVTEAIRQAYEPKVIEAVQQGTLEPDFAALYPGLASQMLLYRDTLASVQKSVSEITGKVGTYESQQQTSQAQGVIKEVAQAIDSLAKSDDAFAALKDPEKMNEFVQHLWNLNPTVGQLKDPGFLAGQWLAKNRESYLQAYKANQAKAARTQQARFAKADATTTSRPAAGQEPPKSALDEMVDDRIGFLAGQ